MHRVLLPFFVSLLLRKGGRGVVGELLLLDGGALYADVVEEHAGGDDGLGDDAEGVRDVGVVADGDDAGAEAAVVELVEDGSANELAGAIGVDAVEQAGEEFAAEGFDGVDVLPCSFAMASRRLLSSSFDTG